MRCISNCKALHQKMTAGLLFLCMMAGLTGCANTSYDMAYQVDSPISSYNVTTYGDGGKAKSFASGLCVTSGDVFGDGSLDLSSCESAVLCDLNNHEVLYSQNAFNRLYPASLTKAMTALVALKYGSLDQTLIATENVKIHETGAQLAGIKEGDSMTLYQALRVLMLYSANDVAMLIAEGVGGTVDHFIEMMNEEAAALGATGTHFANPHGLTDSEHYTTAYDLYLIFQECVKYEEFINIISLSTYDTTYFNKAGTEMNLSVKNTNGYLSGSYKAPEGVNVVGGKTGTTAAAGHCLMMYAKDNNGSPVITVVLKSDSTDSVYSNTSQLFGQMK